MLIFCLFLCFSLRIFIPKIERYATNLLKKDLDLMFNNYSYLTSKSKAKKKIIRESAKTGLENHTVYKCKEQVKSLQSPNPPCQKPPYKFPFHDDLFSPSRVKLITYNKLLSELSFYKSSIKNQSLNHLQGENY